MSDVVTTMDTPHHHTLTELRRAAAEIARIAEDIRHISARTTSALPHSPGLVRALTHPRGLGYAFEGGPIGSTAARLGGMAGQESLAVLVAVTSLRLRIAAVALIHPEILTEPAVRDLIDAVTADRDIAATRIMRAMFKDKGATAALSAIAPIATEITAMRALLDENPLNDTTGWNMATGRLVSADPLLGITTKAITTWDRGEGAAEPVDLKQRELDAISQSGSVLGFLHNIAVIRTNGRILLQEVRGPDGVSRYVVQAPGMAIGKPINDSPQDFVGAWRNTLLGDSPYVKAIAKAMADFAIPVGADLALVGHSEGGAAVMNLAQDPAFCHRYRVTHVVAVGAPIDFKTCADPRTWVASITNQHDIIPSLDGQGTGNPFDLHPDWYLVDYTDAGHSFPSCHGIDTYLANLRDDLDEAREHIEGQLAPYRGPITRTQAYRLWDRPRPPEGFPFLAVPTTHADTSAGPVDLPVKHSGGATLLSFFTADAHAARRLAAPALPVMLGRRAVVVVGASACADGSLGPYGEVSVSVLVHDPWRVRRLGAWTELFAPAGRRRSGVRIVQRAVTTAAADAAGREFWGLPSLLAPIDLDLGGAEVRAAVHDPGRPAIMELSGTAGPRLPLPSLDTVLYSQLSGAALRANHQYSGHFRGHPAPRLRLSTGASTHPMAQCLRALGIDGARPFLAVSAPHYRALLGAGLALPIPREAP